MTILEIQFDNGELMFVQVSEALLASMLELRPDRSGVAFRDGLRFSVIDEDGRREMRPTRYVGLAAVGG